MATATARFEQRPLGAITRGLELRQAPEGSSSPGTIAGYAAVYDSLSDDLGGFMERIAPGAFDRALEEAEIVCLRNHEPEALLGRNSSGTLRLRSDDKGLMFECDLPATTAGRDTAEMIRRGDMKGCSFSFDVREQSWDLATGETPIRTLRDVDVADVGPVTTPAYRDTSVALRSLEAHRPPPAIPVSLALARLRLRIAEAF